jgi:hypothetical protein
MTILRGLQKRTLEQVSPGMAVNASTASSRTVASLRGNDGYELYRFKLDESIIEVIIAENVSAADFLGLARVHVPASSSGANSKRLGPGPGPAAPGAPGR